MSSSNKNRRAKADKLWRIWYALLVLAVHAFLLYATFRRYAGFRSRALREQWPMGPMNFHLAASITAALLLPLFLYAAFLRTGNYSEDGIQIGSSADSLRDVCAAGQHPGWVCIGRIRQHFMPYTCALHLLMALCLLVPLPVLEAEEILRGQMGKDSVWRTNLDFILNPTASATNIVSTEIFNLVLALAILVVRYPSVFWYTNRAFSLLYSVILCICGLHAVLAYEATSVLYKAASTDSATVVVNLPPAAVLALHVVGDLLMLMANAAFFEFGYAQVLGSLRRRRHYLQLEAPSSGCSDRSNGSSSCSSDSQTPCWLSYAPHLIGILLMVLAVLCKAPVLWDWVGLYKSHQQPIMLAAVISGCVYLFLWIAVWLLLGCRSSWQFNIHPEMELPGKQLTPGYAHGRAVPSAPDCRRSPPSSGDSDLSKKSNQYVYLQQQQQRMAEGHAAMIPTVSEQVDNGSENSYACGGGGGGGGTLDRQAGLVKYQVRRNSAQMLGANGSLKRNAALLQRTKSGNRVTFKERHETIPGSPGSSQNTSSDSGIEASRIHGQAALQISLHDDYARVNKQPRPASRQSSNYDDYPMLGCLFGQTDGAAVAAAAAAAEYYQTDPYGRPLPGVPVLPPPPAGYGAAAAAADFASDPYGGYPTEAMATTDYRGHGVPDILLSRSPFASLGRSNSKPTVSGNSAADYYEMQHQQLQHELQLQQQQHVRSGSYASLPQPQQPVGDQVEGLCSQV